MATKSILEIDEILANDMDNGQNLYSGDSYTFMQTAGGNAKLRRIKISEFFSKVFEFAGSAIFHAGLDYTGLQGTKALDATTGQLITKYADDAASTKADAALENAKAYTDSELKKAIDELKSYINSKAEEVKSAAVEEAKAYTDSEIESVIEEAKTEATAEAKAYIDSIKEEIITEAKNEAINEAKTYVDSKLEETKTDAVYEANAYTDSKIEELQLA